MGKRLMLIKEIINSLLFLFLVYLIIGAFSLMAVAMGENIPYMLFWHKPWEILFDFLK